MTSMNGQFCVCLKIKIWRMAHPVMFISSNFVNKYLQYYKCHVCWILHTSVSIWDIGILWVYLPQLTAFYMIAVDICGKPFEWSKHSTKYFIMFSLLYHICSYCLSIEMVLFSLSCAFLPCSWAECICFGVYQFYFFSALFLLTFSPI